MSRMAASAEGAASLAPWNPCCGLVLRGSLPGLWVTAASNAGWPLRCVLVATAICCGRRQAGSDCCPEGHVHPHVQPQWGALMTGMCPLSREGKFQNLLLFVETSNTGIVQREARSAHPGLRGEGLGRMSPAMSSEDPKQDLSGVRGQPGLLGNQATE